jgi:hypothetical protein
LIITDGCPDVVGRMRRADAADAHRDFNFHHTINSGLVPEKIIQLSMVQICLSMGQVCLIKVRKVIYRPKTRYNML